jgi:hypothetical protein
MFAILLISFVVLTAWIAASRRRDSYLPYLGRYEGSELQSMANVSAIDDAVADSKCLQSIVRRCNGDCDAATVTTETYKCKVRAVSDE